MDILEQFFAEVDVDLLECVVDLDGFAQRRRLAALLRGLPDALVERFEEDRHAEEHRRLRLFQVLCDVLEAFAVRDGRAFIQRNEESACAFICMVQRQDREEDIPVVDLQIGRADHDVGDQVLMAEHDALAGAGRTGGEEQFSHLFRIDLRVDEPSVACLHEFIAFVDKAFPGKDTVVVFVCIHVDHELQVDLALFLDAAEHLFKLLALEEDGFDFGCRHEFFHLGLVEFLVERHNDAGAADDGQIGDRPLAAVLTGHADAHVLEAAVDKRCTQRIDHVERFFVCHLNVAAAPLPLLVEQRVITVPVIARR